LVDSDGDGVSDELDRCQNHDDSTDADDDGIPDGCDEIIDSDGDGVEDSNDVCPGGDDGQDVDQDDVPDGCDQTPNGGGANDTMPDSNSLEPDTKQNNTETGSQVKGENQQSLVGFVAGGVLVLFTLTWWVRFSKR
jgi:hypothetical protein